MNVEWQVAFFKQSRINGVVIDTLKFRPQSKRKYGLVIQQFNRQIPLILDLNIGCAYINLLHNSTKGDTIVKEKNTNLTRITHAGKDTLINLEQLPIEQPPPQ